MSGPAATAVAALLLAGVLGFAMLAPRSLPEAAAALPTAALLVALGVVSPAAALEQVTALGPTVAFLAAILVLAHLAQVEGVFAWLGSRGATASRGGPRRLLGLTFAAAAGTTAVLSLDATVVLLTPVVLATAVSLRLRPRPHVYACAHLANSASTLLPVSNLTNLLAFSASGLTFAGFTALMALPWLVTLAIEYLVFRRFFADDLRERSTVSRAGPLPAPRATLAVLALTLVGFGASSWTGVEPLWVAILGALVLGARSLLARHTSAAAVLRATAPLFCLFVLTLGVLVEGATTHGLGGALGRILPTTVTLPGLLAVAAVAAVLSNVVNNLPATLLLLTVLGPLPEPGLVLAMLIGVNVGPNLTYVGSLATLLWRRVLGGTGAEPRLTEFTRLGLLTVPVCLVGAVLALWAGLTVVE